MSDRRALVLVIGVVVAGCLVTVVARGSGLALQQRSPEEYAKFLEGAERVSRMQVPRVVEALDLKPGLSVADIGSGSGLFTRPIAKRVAPGIVYAVDIDGALLKIVEQSAKDAGLGNVRTALADAESSVTNGPRGTNRCGTRWLSSRRG
jgi:protein-L-isoaspartate O-methyltransferase